jgi:hypothetical protein
MDSAITYTALRGNEVAGGIEVGPSEYVVHLFIVEVILDQTLGSWYCFFEPIHHSKTVLRVM